MFLSNVDIRNAIKQKLIVCDPFIPENVSVASIDVRLGTKFIRQRVRVEPLSRCDNCGVEWPHVCFLVDEKTGSIKPNRHGIIFEEFEIPIGHNLLMHPGDCILGQTIEYVGSLAPGIISMVLDKSTLARWWISNSQNAGFGDNNALNYTLELVNHGPFLTVLQPGQHIGQVKFAYCNTPADKLYDGKYLHSTSVQGAL
jgi:deoxycytidine triphosphate deaminase